MDEIVPEPPGGAHVSHETLFESVDRVLKEQLAELSRLDAGALVEGRYQKFRSMGRLGREFVETTT